LYVPDALVDRHTGAQRKNEQRDDKAPEVELAGVSQRMVAIGWPLGTAQSIQQQQLVAGIDQRMNRLAQHGRAVGKGGSGEVGQRAEGIAGPARIAARGGTASHARIGERPVAASHRWGGRAGESAMAASSTTAWMRGGPGFNSLVSTMFSS